MSTNIVMDFGDSGLWLCDSWHCNVTLIYSACLISRSISLSMCVCCLWLNFLFFFFASFNAVQFMRSSCIHLQYECTLCVLSLPKPPNISNIMMIQQTRRTHHVCVCVFTMYYVCVCVCVEFTSYPSHHNDHNSISVRRQLRNIHQNTPISLPIFKFISHTYEK